MTPADHLVLRVLLDEYLHADRGDLHPCHYGPYGRAGERLGLDASRVGQIEFEIVGFANYDDPDGEKVHLQAMCDALHTPYPADVLERSL